MKRVLRVAWYRFLVTFRSRCGGLLALLLLVGLVGGLAMAAVAGARRTQSAFPAFLASTNPSDMTVIDATSNDSTVHRTIARLPHVKHVESDAAPTVFPLRPNGSHGPDPFAVGVLTVGTVDGLYFDQDHVTVTEGRMADPKRRDEFVMTAEAARLLHVRLGEVAHFGIYADAQQNAPGFDTSRVQPLLRIDVKLVGIVVFNNQVVQDDVDRVPTYVLFTPALTRSAERAFGASGSLINALQLDHGARDVAAVESELKRAVPNASVQSITSIKTATAERAIRPESIALGVFGGIAALAALVIATQLIGRQLRLRVDELETLRALGANPAMTSIDGLLGIGAAIVLGALLGVAVAVGLSPLAPLGPVRPINPTPGIAFDWTVLGFGALALIIGLSAIAWALAFRAAPHRVIRRGLQATPRRSSMASAAAASGLSVPAVAGIGFALEPGAGRRAVPMRSAIVGTALAMVVVVATVIFAASLENLVSHPALYGWNWTYELRSGYAGVSNIPEQHAAQLLKHDANVAAFASVFFDNFQIDGTTVPILGERPNAAVGPPILSGHALNARDQIVLGANTLTALHKSVGDTVDVTTGAAKPTRLRIVGTATLPAIGNATAFHLEIGTGAVIPDTLIPASERGFGDHDGPEAIFVRVRSGRDQAAALQSFRHIAAALYTTGDGAPTVVTVQRPAEIVNYGTLGTTPALLGAALACGAVIALGLTLSRRSDAAKVTWRYSKRSGSPSANSPPPSPGSRQSQSPSGPSSVCHSASSSVAGCGISSPTKFTSYPHQAFPRRHRPHRHRRTRARQPRRRHPGTKRGAHTHHDPPPCRVKTERTPRTLTKSAQEGT